MTDDIADQNTQAAASTEPVTATSVEHQAERDVRGGVRQILAQIDAWLQEVEHVPVALADDLLALINKHL